MTKLCIEMCDAHTSKNNVINVVELDVSRPNSGLNHVELTEGPGEDLVEARRQFYERAGEIAGSQLGLIPKTNK